jgi:hypothetical protein
MDDLYNIPALIKQIEPRYEFTLRHYTATYYETILYAKVAA